MRPILLLTALSLAASAAPAKANDAVAGGVLGFMGGMIVGNAISRPHYRYVEEDAPVYCHWERRTYFDDYEGVYRSHRVRVCD